MSGARRGITLGLAAAALLLVTLAAGADPEPLASEGSGGWFVEPLDPDEGSGSDLSDNADEPNDGAREAQSAASALLQLVALIGSAILAVLLGRAMLRRARVAQPRQDRPSSPSRPAAPSPELTDAVEEGLATLESGPVDDAIIACWVRLEEAAAGAGVARLPSETATELTVRLLDRFDVPTQSVSRLLELYRTARYSSHHLGEGDRATAVEALHAIGVAMQRVSR